MKEHLSCFHCFRDFHAFCKNADGNKTGADIICTQSYFKSYSDMINSDIYQKRPHNFPFLCENCSVKISQKKAANQKSKIDVIDKRVDKLDKSFDEVKDLLNKVLQKSHSETPISANIEETSSTTTNSYSQALQRQESVNKRSVLTTSLGLRTDRK